MTLVLLEREQSLRQRTGPGSWELVQSEGLIDIGHSSMNLACCTSSPLKTLVKLSQGGALHGRESPQRATLHAAC